MSVLRKEEDSVLLSYNIDAWLAYGAYIRSTKGWYA